jgi:hypothetical protein
MSTKSITCVGSALILAAATFPAAAGQYDRNDIVAYWPGHHAIYELHNDIAYLEANPDADEVFKGPAITRAHAEIKRLQAAIGPRPPKYFTPCCYSRRPIHIR